jgi:hypothetical protein
MVVVSLAKPSECLRIMADNNSLHTIGNGGLPRIVFTHSLISASLVQRNAIAMLLTYRLLPKRAEGLTNGYGIFSGLHYLRIRDR